MIAEFDLDAIEAEAAKFKYYVVLETPTALALVARIRQLEDVVTAVANCDPQPTTYSHWCYFCGRSLVRLTTEPLETGHDEDCCLWVKAREATS